jgi:hypothetical protein
MEKIVKDIKEEENKNPGENLSEYDKSGVISRIFCW